jgi:hypothetical protein
LSQGETGPLIPKFCPSCGRSIPICVDEDDIRGAVDDQADPALTWTRPVCRYEYLYEIPDAKKTGTTSQD